MHQIGKASLWKVTYVTQNEAVSKSTALENGIAPRVTRKRSETRARLLDAAFTVFAERGFGQANIEEICDSAGFSRGAFYSNFESLDQLFFAMYEQQSTRLVRQVVDTLDAAPSNMSVLSLIDLVVEALHVDRGWVLVKTDFLLYAARTPSAANMLSENRSALRDALKPALARMLDPADLPPTLRNPEALVQAITEVHDGVMSNMLLDHDTEHSKRRLHDVLAALLVHSGYSSVPPRESE